MSSPREHEIVEELSSLLLDVLMLPEPPPLPARYATEESFSTLYAYLVSLRSFLYESSNGDLFRQIPLKGFVGGTLKTLQANLRHMTWQTQMVAAGDFSQRIEFMGEFSESFNAMVARLDQTLQALRSKESELRQTNEDLHKEITIRKQTEAALRKSKEDLSLLAITDPLTGLYNRRHFNKLAEDEIVRAIRYARPLSVMIFDIDFFKRVNDNFGHAVGDQVIQKVAQTTRGMLRATEIAARYGGEEFIVLFPETSAPEAAVVAERLRKKIEEAVVYAEKTPIRVTASFGVCDHLAVGDDSLHEQVLSEFFNNSDRAMYASKNAGRNRVTVFPG